VSNFQIFYKKERQRGCQELEKELCPETRTNPPREERFAFDPKHESYALGSIHLPSIVDQKLISWQGGGKYQKQQSKGAIVESGDWGVFVTCDMGRESKCIGEALDIFSQVSLMPGVATSFFDSSNT